MFDIDRFKRVNDTFGHQRGDAVLKRLVEIVTQNIRDSDIVARIGGEEFLVLLPRTNGENALRIAEKLRGIVAESAFEELPWQITISIGVGNLSDGESLDAALARVDEALYAAKRKGRNRVERSSAMFTSFRRKT
jgi:diguanylate cyclase (GGDEF)-like protein